MTARRVGEPPFCCDRVYICDGKVECPVHAGFDVCCDRPDLHRTLPNTEWQPWIDGAVLSRTTTATDRKAGDER